MHVYIAYYILVSILFYCEISEGSLQLLDCEVVVCVSRLNALRYTSLPHMQFNSEICPKFPTLFGVA